MLNLNMFNSLEKICLGVIGGALLVSIVGATHLMLIALIVGAGSFGIRKFINRNAGTPPTVSK